MLDATDREILRLLKTNCKMQLRDIGEIVHLTGQAVSNRIARLETLGVIRGYSAVLDDKLLGTSLTAYITIFMKTTSHSALQTFLQHHEAVTEAARISGDGCYLVKLQTGSQEELNVFLDTVLQYGNYRVNIALSKIK